MAPKKSDALVSMTVTWEFKEVVSVSEFHVDFFRFNMTSSSTLKITVDDKLCHAISMNTFVGVEGRYPCHSARAYGRVVTLNITSFDTEGTPGKYYNDNNLFKICNVRIFACHPAFYGPRCDLQCRCMSLPCHPITGTCADEKVNCRPGYKGGNCAIGDALYGQVSTKVTSGKIRGQYHQADTWNVTSLASVLATSWVFRKTIHLPRVHTFTHFTLSLNREVVPAVLYASVHLDRESSEFGWSRGHVPVRGLPCSGVTSVESQNLTLFCQGSGSIVSLFLYGTVPLPSSSVQEFQSWQCADGRWGHACQHVCQCNDTKEVCDKSTGRCLSGCIKYDKTHSCQNPFRCKPGHCVRSCQTKGYRPRDKKNHRCTTSRCVSGFMGVRCDVACPDGFFGSGCNHACVYCNPKGTKHNVTCQADSGACTKGCRPDIALPGDGVSCHAHGEAVMAKESLGHISGVASGRDVTVLLVTLTLMLGTVTIGCSTVMPKMTRRGVFVSSIKDQFVWRHQMDKRMNETSQDSIVAYHQQQVLCNNGVLDNLQKLFLLRTGHTSSTLPKFKSAEEGWQWLERGRSFNAFHSREKDGKDYAVSLYAKVAIWILSQDFDERVEHQRRKLALCGAYHDLAWKDSSDEFETSL